MNSCQERLRSAKALPAATGDTGVGTIKTSASKAFSRKELPNCKVEEKHLLLNYLAH